MTRMFGCYSSDLLQSEVFFRCASLTMLYEIMSNMMPTGQGITRCTLYIRLSFTALNDRCWSCYRM